MSSRSGPRLVTAADRVVRVWRAGRLEATFSGYAGTIKQVGIDGDDVYAITSDATVVDTIGAPARRRTLGAGTRTITDVRFDRELGRILGASWNQYLYLWDAASGTLLRKLDGTGPMAAVRISPDGSLMIGVGGIYPAVWDRRTGTRLGQLEGHSDYVTDGEFIDDQLFASVASNHTALIWDLAARRPLTTFRNVDALAISDDRRTVALVGATGVRVWTPRVPVPDLAALPALEP
jgi:WD40 repeat protein